MRHDLLVTILFVLGGCCSREQIPGHVKGLYAKDAKTRSNSALKLAQCGSDSGPAVGRLIELMYEPNVGVQSSAAYALRKIDTPEARRAIEKVEESRRRH